MVLGQPPEPPIQDDFEQELNIEDDMDGALEGMFHLCHHLTDDERRADHSYRTARAIGRRSPECEWSQRIEVSSKAEATPQAVLMTFILDTTIGLGIWLPFTIGKSTALLTVRLCGV